MISFLLNPTDKNEEKNIMSLNPLKAIGLDDIPKQILELLTL